jgi:hypothetical protein
MAPACFGDNRVLVVSDVLARILDIVFEIGRQRSLETSKLAAHRLNTVLTFRARLWAMLPGTAAARGRKHRRRDTDTGTRGGGHGFGNGGDFPSLRRLADVCIIRGAEVTIKSPGNPQGIGPMQIAGGIGWRSPAELEPLS